MARKLYVTKTQKLCFMKSPGPEPITFEMGMFETSDEAEQKFLETHPQFGQKFRLASGMHKPVTPEVTTKGVATTGSEPGRKPDLAEVKPKK